MKNKNEVIELSLKAKSAVLGISEVYTAYFYIDSEKFLREFYEAKHFGDNVLHTPVAYYNNISVKEKLFGYMVKEGGNNEPFLVLGLLTNNSHSVTGTEAKGYAASDNNVKIKEGDILISENLSLMAFANASAKNIAPRIEFNKPEEKESLIGSVHKKNLLAPQYEILNFNKTNDKIIYSHVKKDTNKIVENLTNSKKQKYTKFVNLNLGGKVVADDKSQQSSKAK